MVDIILLYFAGILVGILSSFFGVGGGILIVPLLYFLYPTLPSASVISVSLCTIFITTIMNTVKFYRLGFYQHKKAVLFLGSFCVIGGLIGSFLLPHIPSDLLKKVFGAFLFFIATKNLMEIYKKKIEVVGAKPADYKLALGGFGGAFLSSLTGLGGGVIFIPVFVNILRLTLTQATAYSNIGMSLSTFVGVIPHMFAIRENVEIDSPLFEYLVVGRVFMFIVLCLFLGATLGSKWGIKLNLTMPEKKKKLLLCGIIYLVILQIFLS